MSMDEYYIRQLEQKANHLRAQIQAAEPMDPNGMWKVSTEGDCEGKTTRKLGVHIGNIFDIAYALRGESTYQLEFERLAPDEWPYARPVKHSPPNSKDKPKGEFHISIRGEGIPLHDSAVLVRKLQGCCPSNIRVTKSNYYFAARLNWR